MFVVWQNRSLKRPRRNASGRRYGEVNKSHTGVSHHKATHDPTPP